MGKVDVNNIESLKQENLSVVENIWSSKASELHVW